MFKIALSLATVTALLCFPAHTQNPPSTDIGAALSKLDMFIADTMQKTTLPGLAVGVVYQGRVVFLKGYGIRKLGDPARVDPDTVFEIASVSKPLTSTIVASLVGSGTVSWDDRIETLDPDFALSDKTASEQVTLRDMFSHRSGLPTGAGDVLEELGYSRPEILHRLHLVPLAGQFRETYHYSNFGFTEGALAASLRTGETWEEVAQQQLYGKIGMRSTSSRYSDYENNPNKAALHYLHDGVYSNWFTREADSEAPAGGVSSNVRDLANFLQLQLGDGMFDGQRVIDKTALDETHKPEMCAADQGPAPPGKCSGSYYGMGWNVSKDAAGLLMLSHSGAFDLGTGTAIYLLPEKQVGIVVLTNGTPVGIPESVCLSFLDYVRYGSAKVDYLTIFKPIFEQMFRRSQDASPDYSKRKPPLRPLSAAKLSTYVGTYISPYYGKLRIDVEQSRLILRLPPRDAYYDLKHWDGDIFTYYFAGENTGVARRGLKFLDGGKQVLVENLAIANDGIFTRVN